jgi:hypothetical protein
MINCQMRITGLSAVLNGLSADLGGCQLLYRASPPVVCRLENDKMEAVFASLFVFLVLFLQFLLISNTTVEPEVPEFSFDERIGIKYDPKSPLVKCTYL